MKFLRKKLMYIILPLIAVVVGLGLFFGVGLINRNTNVFDMDDLEDVVSESVSDYEVEMKKYDISNCTFENSDVFAEIRFGEDVTFTNCVFDGATESAIFMESKDGNVDSAVATLIGCKIINGDSGSDHVEGLAINAWNSTVNLINTTIENNTADFGDLFYMFFSNINIDYDESLIENGYESNESLIANNQCNRVFNLECGPYANFNNVTFENNNSIHEEVFVDSTELNLKNVNFDGNSTDLRNYVVGQGDINKQIELIPHVDGAILDPVYLMDNQLVNSYTTAVSSLMPVSLNNCNGWYSNEEMTDVFEIEKLGDGEYSNKSYDIYTTLITNEDIAKNLSFSINEEDSNYMVQKADGVTGVVKIPATYLNVPVTALAGAAFASTAIIQVFLNTNITKIPDSCFESCQSLQNIQMTNNIIDIGRLAFYQCSLLSFGSYTNTPIHFSDSLVYIGFGAFAYTSLTQITIPVGVKLIQTGAFGYLKNLTIINYNAESLSDQPSATSILFTDAGTSASGITVNFGKKVKTIPDYLFYSTSSGFVSPNITAVNFEENSECTTIGSYAFSSITSLTTMELPNKVQTINQYAFANSTNLDIPTLPSSLKEIGIYAFNNSGLKTAHIPEKITTIPNYAFTSCNALKEITIPSMVTSIGTCAFAGCDALTQLNYYATNCSDFAYSTYCFSDSITPNGFDLYIGKNVLKIPAYFLMARSKTDAPTLKSITFEDGSQCQSIGNQAFRYILTLKEVSFPSSLKDIGSYAFSNTGIERVDFNEGLTTIGSGAFNGCDSLDDIYLPASLSEINVDVFRVCQNLKSIKISKDNTKYSDANSNVIMALSGSTYLNGSTTYTASENTVIYGCNGSIIPYTATTVASNAFYELENLTALYIPSSITSLGSNAFYKCNNINTIVVDDENTTYKSDGNNAILSEDGKTFVYGCKNSVIPSGVTTIGITEFLHP